MTTKRPATLRNVLSIAAIVITLLVLTAAVSLVFATTIRQSTRAELTEAIERVRAIEEAEVGLLLHTRARDGAELRKLEVELRNLLTDATRYISTADEKRAFQSARAAVEHYLDLAHEPQGAGNLRDAELRAIAALEQLTDVVVEDARAAQARALRWSRIANIGAIAFGIAIIAITFGVVLWLRRRAIRPLFALANTMKRFGNGELDLRAPEQGATELREMMQRFNEMADSLAAQRQARIAFVGGVAHDLKNPLSAMKLALAAVAPGQPLPPEPQLRRMLALVERQVTQIDRMVGDFFELTKLEAGGPELHLEPHDIGEIVRGSIELFDATAQARVHLTLPDHPVVVACDALRIGQAVTNLVSNAIKYSPSAAPVEVRVATPPSELTIEVIDHGIGIRPDEVQRIFEPFQRGTVVKTDVPGTGLGLYNVRRIVHAHGGTIDIASKPGEGSTFRIRLARVPAHEPLPVAAQPVYRH